MQQQDKRSRFIEAWKTVFDTEEVHDDDNFFEVGGNSLKGMQLVSALAERGLKLDMLKIYTQPMVEEMIEELEEMDPVEIPQELFTGQMTGEQLEKYLQDPQVRKAMADFGIREEDVREHVKTVEEEHKEEQCASPWGIPLQSCIMPGMPAQTGGSLQGYLIPVQLMLYVPAIGPDGKAQMPEPGAFPLQLMAYPVNWPKAPVPNQPPQDPETKA